MDRVPRTALVWCAASYKSNWDPSCHVHTTSLLTKYTALTVIEIGCFYREAGNVAIWDFSGG